MSEIVESERDERRTDDDFGMKQRCDFVEVTRGKTGAALALAVAEHAARWAGIDDGPAPEYCREQQIRAAQTLAKVADPVRKLEEAMATIAAQIKRIEALEALLRGRAPQSNRDSGAGRGAAIQ